MRKLLLLALGAAGGVVAAIFAGARAELERADRPPQSTPTATDEPVAGRDG